MTTALDALARLDAGPGLPGDLAVADQYDRQLRLAGVVEPLWCVHGVNVAAAECNSCFLDHDTYCRRLEDI